MGRIVASENNLPRPIIRPLTCQCAKREDAHPCLQGNACSPKLVFLQCSWQWFAEKEVVDHAKVGCIVIRKANRPNSRRTNQCFQDSSEVRCHCDRGVTFLCNGQAAYGHGFMMVCTLRDKVQHHRCRWVHHRILLIDGLDGRIVRPSAANDTQGSLELRSIVPFPKVRLIERDHHGNPLFRVEHQCRCHRVHVLHQKFRIVKCTKARWHRQRQIC